MRGRERRPHPRLPLTRSPLGVVRVSPTLGRGAPGLREGLRPSDAWSRAGRPHQVVIHPGGASHPAPPGVTSLLGSFVACASATPTRRCPVPGPRSAWTADRSAWRSFPTREVTPAPRGDAPPPGWATLGRVSPPGEPCPPPSAGADGRAAFGGPPCGKGQCPGICLGTAPELLRLGRRLRSCPPWVAGCAAFAAWSPLRSHGRP